MGSVYEAEEQATGRRVAIKLIRAEFADSPEAVERFRREGRLASTIAAPALRLRPRRRRGGRPALHRHGADARPEPRRTSSRRRGPLADRPRRSGTSSTCIEGLEEAHRCGVVHRDVKPSNCFLDADGRVKVGDFGLAKSLVGEQAADAQRRVPGHAAVRLAGADPQRRTSTTRTDVYSVCATLYFLLTGRAPFHDGDAAATLARTVSEPAPPMRALRPGLPRHARRGRPARPGARPPAALPRPGRVPPGAAAVRAGQPRAGRAGPARVAAYLTDWVVFLPLFFLLDNDFVGWAFGAAVPSWPLELAADLLWPLYFLACESLWGGTPGKHLLRLRVCGRSAVDPPAALRVFVRTAVFFGAGLAAECYSLLFGVWDSDVGPVLPTLGEYLGLHALGLALVASTMRRRNGYRGLHELLSGTRVVSLPAPEERAHFPAAPPAPPAGEKVGAGRVGPFAVRGSAAPPCVLRGEDSALGREVVVWLRPGATRGWGRGPRSRGRRGRAGWPAGGGTTGRRGTPSWRRRASRWPPWPRRGGACAGRRRAAAARTARRGVGGGRGRRHVADGADAGASVAPARRPGATAGRAAVRRQCVGRRRARPAAVAGPARRRGGVGTGGAAPRRPEGRCGRRSRRTRRRRWAGWPGPGRPTGAPPSSGRRWPPRRDLPRRVSRARRAASLTSWAAVNGVGLAVMLVVSGLAPAFMHFAAMAGQLKVFRSVPGQLRGGADVALAVAALQPALPDRLRGVAQWEADRGLADRLEALFARRRADEQAAAGRLPPASRALVGAARRWIDEREEDGPGPGDAPPHPGEVAALRAAGKGLEDFLDTEARAAVVAAGFFLAGLLLVWPALAVTFTFLSRGGLGLRAHGLTLVRGDGRPAGRFRCAWRAAVLWAPFTALLVLSVVLSILRLGRPGRLRNLRPGRVPVGAVLVRGPVPPAGVVRAGADARPTGAGTTGWPGRGGAALAAERGGNGRLLFVVGAGAADGAGAELLPDGVQRPVERLLLLPPGAVEQVALHGGLARQVDGPHAQQPHRQPVVGHPAVEQAGRSLPELLGQVGRLGERHRTAVGAEVRRADLQLDRAAADARPGAAAGRDARRGPAASARSTSRSPRSRANVVSVLTDRAASSGTTARSSRPCASRHSCRPDSPK